jgi:3-deoxy-manno-octulosonate cytidylyltransferase (CMP-KDO synthetase)
VIDAAVDALLEDDDTSIATVVHALEGDARQDPNRVKVVLDRAGFALYFSRSPIPYERGTTGTTWQHVGLYAYRRPFLQDFVSLPRTPAECAEELEQLRALEHGHRIRVAIVEGWRSVPVDVPEDVESVEALLAELEAGGTKR